MTKKKASRKGATKEYKPLTSKPKGLTLNDVELSVIRLLHSHADVNITGGVIPDKYLTSIGTNVGGNSQDKNVLVNVVFEIKSDFQPADTPEANQSMANITGVFQCVFNSKIDFTEEDLTDEFQETLARTSYISSGPFIRHHVYSLMTQMGIPPLTMPIFRAIAPVDAKKMEDPPENIHERKKK